MTAFSSFARRTVAVGSAATLIASGAGTASAHVTINPKSADAGSWSVLTFQVPHGCGDSPTTSVDITVPDNVYIVTPTVNPNWTINAVKTDVNPPVAGPHGDITSRTSHVVYTAKTPLDAHQRDTFELSIKVPDLAKGTSLVFPTLQKCVTGETNWDQIPAPGADYHSVKHPAPSVTIGKGAGDHHGHGGHGDQQAPAGLEGLSSEYGGVLSGAALVASLGALAAAAYSVFALQQSAK